MTSSDRPVPVGGKSAANPDFPCGVGERIRAVGLSFGRSGGSPGALHSPWISRLRPPPRRAPLFLPAAEWDATAAAPQSVRFRGAVPTHGLLTGARSPATDPTFPSRLLCRDARLAAASSSRHMLLQQRLRQQQREGEVERWNGREVARDEKEGHVAGHRNGIPAGFGPFQVEAKRARLLLAKRGKLQQEHTVWKLEDERVGSFPFLRRMARLGAVRGVVEGAAEREGQEEGLLLVDEGGRVSAPPERGQLEVVGGEGCGCRPWETPPFPQSGTLCTSPNIGIANNTGSGDAAGSSRILKTSQWLHRHRWGENSRLLDCYPISSPWPVGKGSTICRRVSRLCPGPQDLIDEASGRRLPDHHTQGAAYEEYTDQTATTRTFYAPHSNEPVQQQFVIKSSFWNIERVERTRVLSSLHPKLALGKTDCRKRILDPDEAVLSQSQRLRTWD